MLMKKIGIDVSEHQEEINWEEVKGQVDFAILRLGWIGNKDNHTLDKYFERNYSECKRLEIPVGVYVYSYCVTIGSIYSAINWNKEKIKGKTFEYPLFIDLEDSQLKELNKETMTTLALKFCQSFNEVKTGVYANKDWFINKINVSRLNGYKIWLAEWNNHYPCALLENAAHDDQVWLVNHLPKAYRNTEKITHFVVLGSVIFLVLLQREPLLQLYLQEFQFHTFAVSWQIEVLHQP